MKLKFYIANRDGTFVETKAYLLNYDLVAHRTEGDKGGWTISDYESGRAVCHRLSSLTACKNYVQCINPTLLENIKEYRKTDDYKIACQKVVDFVKSQTKKEL